MINRIIISLLFLSVGFSQQEYNGNDLIEMDNGLWTEKFSDEPITGRVFGLFGENKPYKKVYLGNLRKGKRDGWWNIYYYPTGQKQYAGTWDDGKELGLHIGWYENGKKEIEGVFKNGKIISLKRWNRDGSVKE